MRQGARTDIQPSANLRKVSQPEAAALLNVGLRSVQHARKVLDEGAQARAYKRSGQLYPGVLVVPERGIAARSA